MSTEDGSIFSHQISCLVLIYRSCKFDDEGEYSGIFKINSREIILLLLDLIQVNIFFDIYFNIISNGRLTNGLFHFFSIQGCGRQFSKFIFGPEKTGILGGGTENYPWKPIF